VEHDEGGGVLVLNQTYTTKITYLISKIDKLTTNITDHIVKSFSEHQQIHSWCSSSHTVR
jgi:hypothetical protein